jgi:hypothetical protein
MGLIKSCVPNGLNFLFPPTFCKYISSLGTSRLVSKMAKKVIYISDLYHNFSFLSGKCMYLSGLIPEPMNAMQDFKLLDYGIGFTNIVARTTRGSADLTR